MFKQMRKNKDGKIISYRLICSGKDPNNGKHKNYTKTWKVPQNLDSVRAINKELLKVEIEFENEVEQLSSGTKIIEQNVMFEDFANEFLSNLILRKEKSFTYHERIKGNLKIIIPYFKKYSLNNITPKIIENFYSYLLNRTKLVETVSVKSNINELLNEHKISKTALANETGFNRLTIRTALQVGRKVSKSVAIAICDYFKVPLSKYFDIRSEYQKYSNATNKSIRTTLVMILGKAKSQQIIEHNFATSEYQSPFDSGEFESTKTVYSRNETKEFISCLKTESNIKTKTILSILIETGMRRGEVAGLEWKDIDFNTQKLTINRNSLYVASNGVITKRPKTKNSCRTITLSSYLINIINDYKQWWDKQKTLLGDLWLNTDRLFVQTNGKPINPCSITHWLNKFQIENGLRHISVHELRHTVITNFILADIPVNIVSYFVGHSDPKLTLSVYTHYYGQNMASDIEKYMDRLYGNTINN